MVGLEGDQDAISINSLAYRLSLFFLCAMRVEISALIFYPYIFIKPSVIIKFIAKILEIKRFYRSLIFYFKLATISKINSDIL